MLDYSLFHTIYYSYLKSCILLKDVQITLPLPRDERSLFTETNLHLLVKIQKKDISVDLAERIWRLNELFGLIKMMKKVLSCIA